MNIIGKRILQLILVAFIIVSYIYLRKKKKEKGKTKVVKRRFFGRLLDCFRLEEKDKEG